MRTSTAILLTAILLAGCQTTHSDAQKAKREASASSRGTTILAKFKLDGTGRVVGKPKIMMEDGSPAPEREKAFAYNTIMKAQPLPPPPDHKEREYILPIIFE